jgi:hypothetical protein
VQVILSDKASAYYRRRRAENRFNCNRRLDKQAVYAAVSSSLIMPTSRLNNSTWSE